MVNWCNQLTSYFKSKITCNQASLLSGSLATDIPLKVACSSKMTTGMANLLKFPSISLEDLLVAIRSFKSGPPPDPCTPSLFAKGAPFINQLANKVLNTSLPTEVVPVQWKQSKILPLLKKPSADPRVQENY